MYSAHPKGIQIRISHRIIVGKQGHNFGSKIQPDNVSADQRTMLVMGTEKCGENGMTFQANNGRSPSKDWAGDVHKGAPSQQNPPDLLENRV